MKDGNNKKTRKVDVVKRGDEEEEVKIKGDMIHDDKG